MDEFTDIAKKRQGGERRMDYQVNTEEVRRAARELRAVEEEVRNLSSQNVRTMQAGVQESMEGETAEALNKILEELSADISKISSGIDAVRRALLDYAQRVEEADEKIQKLIRG